jgi:chemotaxis protein methyltransferase CheR
VRPVDFNWVRQLLAEHAAIVLDEGKVYLVEARLPPVARAHGFTSVEELIVAARAGRRMALRLEIVDALTTNETSFFRDRTAWAALREEVLPELIERRRGARTLRVWSAACSTGQEPYTVAMLIHEHFPELQDWRVDILATDVSRSVLEQAQQGIFGAYELERGLPASTRSRYFARLDRGRSQICDDIRRRVRFRQLNLAGPWPALPTFDLVFIRNVLIYFDAATKQDVLSRAEARLARDGFLLLGSGESTLNLDLGLKRLSRHQAWFYQIG